MTTEYEYYDTGDTGIYSSIYGVNWEAQTFTVGAQAHTLVSVVLKLYKYNSTRDVVVSIKATDGSGHPTGDDLTSHTFSASLLGNSPGSFYEIVMDLEISLAANTKYAIVMRQPSGGSSTDCIGWRTKANGYADGNLETSANSGSSWTARSYDAMFRVYGNAGILVPTVTTQAASNLGLD
jgi:hypothetical protein